MGITRREAVGRLAALGTALLPGVASGQPGERIDPAPEKRIIKRGRIKQSVCRGAFGRVPLKDLCLAAAEMGLAGIDLLGPKDWEIARSYGLVCSMGYGGGGTIKDGLNVKANHDVIVKNLEQSLPQASKANVANVITFFGNRQPDMTDAEAIDNCISGLNGLKRLAEDCGVTVCVELLNSKVNHKGYLGDHTSLGVQVVKAVDSPRVKLLYDIYHMQIMEGDVIRTIRDNHSFIAHYHTGGVPDRHEIDDTQELNYPAICRAIVETGFLGYLAHEFTPLRDPITSLRDAASLCDV